MKASLLRARNHTVAVSVEIEDAESRTKIASELTVTYNTTSPSVVKGINAAMTRNPDSKGEDDKFTIDLPTYCSAVVIEIAELTDDEGNPFALTSEFWQTLDVAILSAIYKAINEDQNPDPSKPASSPAA